jgi:ABC-type antimicrobial peptide transport system permease subunit
MDIRDVLWLSYKDLSEKKIRTALTIMMVIIGVAAIVALTSVTAGISNSISSSLESLGPTSIILTSSSTTGFTVADVATLSSLKNVSSVTPILSGQASIFAGNQNSSATLIGVTPQGLTQLLGGNATLYQGAFYQEGITPEAIVGHAIAFPTATAGMQTITVGQTATLKTAGRSGGTFSLPVVGILPSRGGFIIPIDTAVFLPLSAAELILHRSSFNEMLVLASNTSNVNSTATTITAIYGSSARVITTAQLLKTTSTIIGSISLLFTIIAGVSLLVAAIGIMNIMLIAVYERTHEIGILKSVGFKNRHIMLIFLFQALIIGFVGGIIGIGAGAGASYSLATVLGSGSRTTATNTTTTSSSASTRGSGAGFGGGTGAAGGGGFGGGTSSSSSSISFQPAFPITTIIYALLVAIIVSVIAGIYPAWKASKMQPIDALREL